MALRVLKATRKTFREDGDYHCVSKKKKLQHALVSPPSETLQAGVLPTIWLRGVVPKEIIEGREDTRGVVELEAHGCGFDEKVLNLIRAHLQGEGCAAQPGRVSGEPCFLDTRDPSPEHPPKQPSCDRLSRRIKLPMGLEASARSVSYSRRARRLSCASFRERFQIAVCTRRFASATVCLGPIKA